MKILLKNLSKLNITLIIGNIKMYLYDRILDRNLVFIMGINF
jgi:hypothetical protein